MAAMRIQCTECHWIGTDATVAKVKDPDGDDIWWVCPMCRTPESFNHICDEPGCTRTVSCGTPIPGGYRSTCHQHRPEKTP